jgi:hypothetical protein
MPRVDVVSETEVALPSRGSQRPSDLDDRRTAVNNHVIARGSSIKFRLSPNDPIR